jgi:Zn-dependent protease with chaperone function
MTSISSLYPANPLHLPPDATAASANFKKEVKKVLFAIALFFIVYVILMGLAILLAIACVYAGFSIIVNSGHFLGILAGAGIMSIGIMVCIFLIKFIFAVKKYDDSNTIEITENDQPVLFEFIKQLTIDTQTAFPKKIVLSPEVNAAVYYNDSFWSMLFPVKKNLIIGLGLVNSLNITEFKAVMAHEFGHFSQRSMKLGSFVYNVNKVIYNMLYENNSFASALHTMGNIHAIIYIFVWITIQIVKSIQFILKHMYGFINKSYMGLSREMEFHADAVAASVSGSQSLITALRKIEITDMCYQTVIDKANVFLQEKKRLVNAYENHNVVMQTYAEHNELSLQNNAPVAEETFFQKFQLNKINIKDQWASHPSRTERNKNLNDLGIQAQEKREPAWLLFSNPQKLQQQITKLLYSTIAPEQMATEVNAEEFKEQYIKDVDRFTLPEQYNGFYDDRQMQELDVENLAKSPVTVPLTKETFNNLFDNEQIALTKLIMGNQQDESVLQAILNKQIITKTFDYNGEKMNKANAKELCDKIQKETTSLTSEIKLHEEKVFSFFYQLAKNKGEDRAADLVQRYQLHFENRKKVEEFFALGNAVAQILSPLTGGEKIEFAAAENIAIDLQDETIRIKGHLKNWMSKGIFDSNETMKKQIEEFIQSHYYYFVKPSFLDNEINRLHTILNDTLAKVNVYQFENFKKILEHQLEIYNGLN